MWRLSGRALPTKQPPLARTARCAESSCFQAVSVTTTAAIAARLHDVSGVSLCVPRSPLMRTLLLHEGFTTDRSPIESDWPVMSLCIIPATDTDARLMTVCHAPRRHPTVQPAIFFGQPMCPTVEISRQRAGQMRPAVPEARRLNASERRGGSWSASLSCWAGCCHPPSYGFLTMPAA